MALISGYNEFILDREKWIADFNGDDRTTLWCLAWLIIDTLMKGKGEPVVVRFNDNEPTAVVAKKEIGDPL